MERCISTEANLLLSNLAFSRLYITKHVKVGFRFTCKYNLETFLHPQNTRRRGGSKKIVATFIIIELSDRKHLTIVNQGVELAFMFIYCRWKLIVALLITLHTLHHTELKIICPCIQGV